MTNIVLSFHSIYSTLPMMSRWDCLCKNSSPVSDVTHPWFPRVTHCLFHQRKWKCCRCDGKLASRGVTGFISVYFIHWIRHLCRVSQCLRGDQTEGIHQLGHWSECGWPDRKPHKEHEPDPSGFHHGAGKGWNRMFWINKHSVYVNQAVALHVRSKRVLILFRKNCNQRRTKFD